MKKKRKKKGTNQRVFESKQQCQCCHPLSQCFVQFGYKMHTDAVWFKKVMVCMLSSNSARLWAKSGHAYFLAGMAVLPCLQSQFANYHKITWGHSQFRNLWEKDHNFHLVCDFSIIFPNDFYGLNLVFPRFKASTWFSTKCSLSSLELALKVLSSKVTTLIFFSKGSRSEFAIHLLHWYFRKSLYWILQSTDRQSCKVNLSSILNMWLCSQVNKPAVTQA